MVLNPAARAREFFESSEVPEKRQFLNLVFQNLQLRGVNLSVSVQEPFLTMIGYKEHPTNWRWRESLSLGAAPLVCAAGGLARFCRQNIERDSILSRKANCCLAHLQKKRPGKPGLLFLEVERIELSSLANEKQR